MPAAFAASIGAPRPTAAEALSWRSSVAPIRPPRRCDVPAAAPSAAPSCSADPEPGGRGEELSPLRKVYWFGYAVRAVSFTWHTGWRVMMGQLAPSSKSGAYVRPNSSFRERIDADGPFKPEAGRYRLFVGWGCPWAHRCLLVRALKGLEDVISVTFCCPTNYGLWGFSEEEPDPIRGSRNLRELYLSASPGYRGKSTVPMLFDERTGRVVNNESSEIVRMLGSAFDGPGLARRPELDLYPPALRGEIDGVNAWVYEGLNNGVYRAGFAQTQQAYEEAVGDVFRALDRMEEILSRQRYLCGEALTEADVRAFPTLVRFDSAYYGLFRCNLRRLADYPNLLGYTRELYQMPGVRGTVDLGRVKEDYYGRLFPLNPSGIVPLGPAVDFDAPHGRGPAAPPPAGAATQHAAPEAAAPRPPRPRKGGKAPGA
eukprot:tig00021127_g18706.t1